MAPTNKQTKPLPRTQAAQRSSLVRTWTPGCAGTPSVSVSVEGYVTGRDAAACAFKCNAGYRASAVAYCELGEWKGNKGEVMPTCQPAPCDDGLAISPFKTI